MPLLAGLKWQEPALPHVRIVGDSPPKSLHPPPLIWSAVSCTNGLPTNGFPLAAGKPRNYRGSGLVSEYEAGPRATILLARASDYVTELGTKVEAGGSALPRFLKSSAGPL